MEPLKYPHDRHDGYVMLSMQGAVYVPRFTREDGERAPFLSYKRHWSAWRVLMTRFYGQDYEPCILNRDLGL